MNNIAIGGGCILCQNVLKEIEGAPITRQGLFFSQYKYGTYLHSFFLELVANLELVLILTVFLLDLYVFICLIGLSLRFSVYMAFTLYVLTFLPQTMVGGDVYGYEIFIQYGSCILLVLEQRNPALKETFESL